MRELLFAVLYDFHWFSIFLLRDINLIEMKINCDLYVMKK